MAAGAFLIGALTPASAGCYGECNGYQDNRGRGYYEGPAYRDGYSAPAYYSTGARYYDGGPRGHTVYYERGPEYFVGGYERPLYRSTSYYDDGYGYGGGYGYGSSYSYDGYYDRPYYRSYRSYGYYGRPYRYGYYGYPRYGYGYGYGGGGYGSSSPPYGYGAYSQTGPRYASWGGYGGWGGCKTAYVPYGWSWYRGSSC
jgi:hypothetical protein